MSENTKSNDSLLVPNPEEVRPAFQQKYDYTNAQKLLELKHVKEYFRFKSGDVKYLKAVHDVSFDVYKGEVFGLVGESGCGKTTTGRTIMRLYDLTSGSIYFEGVRIAAGTRWNEKEIKWTNVRAKAQIDKIHQEENQYREELAKAYEEAFGEQFKLSALKDEADPSKHQYYERFMARKAKDEESIASIKEHQREVHDEQMKQIREAHDDDKHYNRHLAEIEEKKVQEKYASLLDKLAAHEPLTPEETAQEAAYKKEYAKAKHTTLSNKIQMIFQDPIASLNPRMTARNIIAEGLVINGIHDKEFINQEVARVLKLVGLVPEHANRYPHEFSGGQRQRIGIARAIIMNPELIVADEPVSALDVSVQAQVINLLNDLRNSLGLTLIFIAHNLSVVKYFCDRIAVMYYGNLVELAESDELFAHPLHPYTKSLLSAVPYPDPIIEKSRKRITYDPTRDHDYSQHLPTWREIVPGHFVRCNDEEAMRYLKELKK